MHRSSTWSHVGAMKNLEGKTAFITGGASGIGFELGRACGASGMRVMLADLDESGLDGALEALRAERLDVAIVRCDVTDATSIRSAADATVERFGKVHLLANNAGVFMEGGAGDLSLECAPSAVVGANWLYE